MAVRNIDLGELWRGRRWRMLLNLIDQLPRTSLLREKQADDLELAEAIAALPETESGQRISSWTDEVAVMAGIYDRLGLLIAIWTAKPGTKAKPLPPYERPSTAVDRARRARRWTDHRDRARRFLGRGGDDD